ncbi:MAG: hypothetical protein WC668_00960 [Patescibacteria group bacterium]
MAIQILCIGCNRLFVMTPANTFYAPITDGKHMEAISLKVSCPHCQRENSAELHAPKPNDREHDGIKRKYVGELSCAGRFTPASAPDLGKPQQENRSSDLSAAAVEGQKDAPPVKEDTAHRAGWFGWLVGPER